MCCDISRSAFGSRRAELVELREYDGKRHRVFTEPLHEFKVDFLRIVTAVDKYEEAGHLLSLKDVVLDYLLYLTLHLLLRCAYP